MSKKALIFINAYSVLKASTGSFLLASLAGIHPPISVKITLIVINIKAWIGFITATLSKEVNSFKIALVGNNSNQATKIPISPEETPIINVSELKTRAMSLSSS